MDLYKFKTTWVYMVSTKPARAREKDPVKINVEDKKINCDDAINPNTVKQTFISLYYLVDVRTGGQWFTLTHYCDYTRSWS